MMKLKVFTVLSLSISTLAQLPKNGGLTDERPTYPSPEEAQYKLVEPKLKTPWTEAVSSDPENVWAEYPRPLLRRNTWANLNGVWEFEKASNRDDVNDVPTGRTLNKEFWYRSVQRAAFLELLSSPSGVGELSSQPSQPVEYLLNDLDLVGTAVRLMHPRHSPRTPSSISPPSIITPRCL
ncbi:hypothetical protein PM082_000602 [Marasmius tenuissimus]|nr:hypothetical protein PM082_000602 [Marasmius tenuissimus]